MVNVEVNIDERQVQHINNMLYQTPDKAKTVFRNSLTRGMTAAKTQATKEIRTRYDIKTGNLRTEQTVKTRFIDEGDAVSGEVSFSGGKIPLCRFHPSPAVRKYTNRFVNGRGGWRVTAPVSAADLRGNMLARPEAFIATFASGHTGMFRRTGRKTNTGKPEIKEYWGFSVADMLDYPEAREAVQKRAEEITAKRLDHELMRMLNGYGTR